MSTATTNQPAAHPAAALDYRKRVREIIEQAIQGQKPDRDELQNILWELGWEKTKYDRLYALVYKRYTTQAEHEQAEAARQQANNLEAERQRIREACDADAANLKAERLAALEVEIAKIKEPLRKFDAKQGATIAQLKDTAAALRDTHYQSAMQRTTDPRVHEAIGRWNNRLLQLQAEAEDCRDRLHERRQHIDDIEWTGTGPKLNGRTIIDRSYWVDQRDSAAEVMNDTQARQSMRDKAARVFHFADARINEIDTATRRLGEIYREQASIEKQIETLAAFFYDWKAFEVPT